MKQLVHVEKEFSNLSSKLNILAVLTDRINLYPVVRIEKTGSYGEAIYTSEASVMVDVDFNMDQEDPIWLEDDEGLADIPAKHKSKRQLTMEPVVLKDDSSHSENLAIPDYYEEGLSSGDEECWFISPHHY